MIKLNRDILNLLDALPRLWHFVSMSTITLHNIDPELKAEAMTIMKQHGLTASDAISAFLRKIVNNHESGLSCFCCDLNPNEETAQDLEDARADRVKYISSQDTDDLFKKLGI
jgi:addiction module RelB/DinJ family antitoxin